jgi:hypothetical protein
MTERKDLNSDPDFESLDRAMKITERANKVADAVEEIKRRVAAKKGTLRKDADRLTTENADAEISKELDMIGEGIDPKDLEK